MKKVVKSEPHVTVYPGYTTNQWAYERLNTFEDQLRDAEALKKQIEKHVYGFSQVYVEWKTEVVCEHCGAGWEEPPACCDRAVAEVPVKEVPR